MRIFPRLWKNSISRIIRELWEISWMSWESRGLARYQQSKRIRRPKWDSNRQKGKNNSCRRNWRCLFTRLTTSKRTCSWRSRWYPHRHRSWTRLQFISRIIWAMNRWTTLHSLWTLQLLWIRRNRAWWQKIKNLRKVMNSWRRKDISWLKNWRVQRKYHRCSVRWWWENRRMTSWITRWISSKRKRKTVTYQKSRKSCCRHWAERTVR